jgi:hypothetical protein
LRFTHLKSSPHRFLKLYEVGGDILNNVDWHKYNDNSCLTVEPDEIILYAEIESIIDLIEKKI